MTKKCFKCGLTKDIAEFYKHDKMKDGHLNKCKECTKIDVRKNYYDNHDHYMEYENRRNQEEYRKANQLKYARNKRSKHPERSRIYVAVERAVKSGKLIPQPCLICGTENRVQAHHKDYNKPFDITWLCIRCHLKVTQNKINLSDYEEMDF
ncbi:MAG: hypothetical protein Q8910_00040 [Bacteroidota bacterium]|nr:hypothetical protein [Bacteroidota bacterium]